MTSRHRHHLRLILTVTASLAIVPGAHAYTPGCYKEVKAICSDVEPGNGRLTDCVAQNQARFSVTCRPEIHAVIEQRGRFTTQCREAITHYCPGVKPGRGRLYACLKYHEEQLSAACKAQLY